MSSALQSTVLSLAFHLGYLSDLTSSISLRNGRLLVFRCQYCVSVAVVETWLVANVSGIDCNHVIFYFIIVLGEEIYNACQICFQFWGSRGGAVVLQNGERDGGELGVEKTGIGGILLLYWS